LILISQDKTDKKIDRVSKMLNSLKKIILLSFVVLLSACNTFVASNFYGVEITQEYETEYLAIKL